MTKHITRCILAGAIAALPIAGLLFAINYLEGRFANLGIRNWEYYFPGLGILLALFVVYLLGLMTTTIMGRIIIHKVDKIVHQMPLLGNAYKSLKQILGYSEGEDQLFQQAVLVKDAGNDFAELGLITNEESNNDQNEIVVFVPNAPNPASGRLIVIEKSKVELLDMAPRDVFKTLLSVGKGQEQMFRRN